MKIIVCVLVILFGASFIVGQPKIGSVNGKPKDSELRTLIDDPKLPRVLLIGDSISYGYAPVVRDLLKGEANVHDIKGSGGATTKGVVKIERWLSGAKWNVIHFNFGLHDLKINSDGKTEVSLNDYQKNLRMIVKKLRKSKAKLIWATTTPVPDSRTNPLRENSDVLAYNAAAAKVIEEADIPTCDLYSFVFPRLIEFQKPRNVHFTDDGYKLLGEKVASMIEEALE